MFDLSRCTFQYDPYPIAYSESVFPDGLYDELSGEWPDTALFAHRPDLGNKYALSSLNNAESYRGFIDRSSSWRRFLGHIESPEFVGSILKWLSANNIDLGLHVGVPGVKDVLRGLLKNRWTLPTPLSARFEFSMMPAAGGSIRPHTDAPNKLVTLVLSMNRRDEWDPGWGGGTSVLKPRDPRASFNQTNRWLEFGDVETLHTFPFVPNQCVTFIKTFNSLHCVHPMTGAGAMRKTLTINIERPQ